MITSAVGKRYATALYELAEEQKQTEAVADALSAFAEAWSVNDELRAVFENPRVNGQARHKIIEALGAKSKAPSIVISTLKLLSDRRRLRNLPEIAEAFRVLDDERSGRVRAEVVTATELPAAYYKRLKETLEKATGKSVVLAHRTDPSLIGGVVTRVGGRIFDGSLKNRLKELRQQLLLAATPGVQAEEA